MKSHLIVTASLALLSLTGCGSSKSPSLPVDHVSTGSSVIPAATEQLLQTAKTDALRTQLATVNDDCKQRYPTNSAKHNADIIQCRRDGLIPLMTAAHVPDIDLVELMLAKDQEIGERQDAGKITRGQAAVEAAQAKEAMIKEHSAREVARNRARLAADHNKAQQQAITFQQNVVQQQLKAQQEAQDQQRWNALTQNGLRLLQGSNAPPVTTTTCNPSWGGSVNCTQTTQ